MALKLWEKNVDDLEISGAILEDWSYFEKIETFLLSDCMGWMVTAAALCNLKHESRKRGRKFWSGPTDKCSFIWNLITIETNHFWSKMAMVFSKGLLVSSILPKNGRLGQKLTFSSSFFGRIEDTKISFRDSLIFSDLKK